MSPTLGVSPAPAATAALPDMKILVPTNLMSIGLDSATGHRMLRYTHITEDAGTGPFEIDPTYNASTGMASFVQSIYTSPAPGSWTVDHTVPLAVNAAFVNGSDYRFPLTRFTLNRTNADGSIGAIAATSPKTDYCITGDNRVADVPNTPTNTSPPAGNCTNPNLPLGWSVGWGDQYDQTDSGQPIDLTGLADGTYVLRAIVDPQHVLTESVPSNNVTDTVLHIAANTVTVGAQTHPIVVPPTVAITSPAAGTTVTGTVNLTVAASATSPATVTKVQYLLDGNPLGAAQTAAPYSHVWTVGSTPVGTHRLSAQVTDSAGNIGTAPVVTVTVPTAGLPPGFAVDQRVFQTGTGTLTTAAFSTRATNETLLAFVAADGPGSPQTATVSGAGLTWSLVRRSNAQPGDAEVWKAAAAGRLTNVSVTSRLSSAAYDQQLTVVSYAGASGTGVSATASAPSGGPLVHLASSTAGSLVYGVGSDYDTAVARTLGAGQALVGQWVDTARGDTFWTQTAHAATVTTGQVVTIYDTAPTADRWNLAAVEIVPHATPPDTTPPVVTVTNPAPGQVVSGTTPVAVSVTDNVAVGSVQFLLDGKPLGTPVRSAPYSLRWNTTLIAGGSHRVSARATDTSGNVGITPGVTVTVANPAPPMTCFVLQTQQSVHGAGRVTTPTLSTAMSDELLVAFVSADGPSAASAQAATVTGGGLTWRLVKRANLQSGDSEVWAAPAQTQLNNVSVTSTLKAAGFSQHLTVIALEGAEGIGASTAVSTASGSPAATVTTTAPAALVFAVGHDSDASVSRTLPVGQVVLDQWLDPGVGGTAWTQYTNQAVTPLGTHVTMAATAPSNHRTNLVAVEVTGDGS